MIFVSEEIKRKRGRPREDFVRSERLNIRVTPDELDMLEAMCAKKGETKTNIIMSALRTQYNLFKFQD